MRHVGLYFVYKPGANAHAQKVWFKNCGLKSNRYIISYIPWFIDRYALYKPANSEVLKRYHLPPFGTLVIYFQTSSLAGLYNL